MVPRNRKEVTTAPGADAAKQVPGAGPLDLRALGLLGEGGALDLTGLMNRILLVEDGAGKSWAQRMVEVWIVEALEANPRAIEDIFDRAEKVRLARESMAAGPSSIDDETAGKILEVLCGSGEVATSDRGDRASLEARP